ncbi:hypothetical protein F511_13101 [Dorcoceras hygrometricum]|uniref:Uncharacterized protein n=1 Tax=Dorcoceras hygrometricum TaxID=472368 RepID=A0A2Z7ATV5_9LAMI|nr:hypothetical protein F511_13101 [Dorcoceras hygrometricum]
MLVGFGPAVGRCAWCSHQMLFSVRVSGWKDTKALRGRRLFEVSAVESAVGFPGFAAGRGFDPAGGAPGGVYPEQLGALIRIAYWNQLRKLDQLRAHRFVRLPKSARAFGSDRTLEAAQSVRTVNQLSMVSQLGAANQLSAVNWLSTVNQLGVVNQLRMVRPVWDGQTNRGKVNWFGLVKPSWSGQTSSGKNQTIEEGQTSWGKVKADWKSTQADNSLTGTVKGIALYLPCFVELTTAVSRSWLDGETPVTLGFTLWKHKITGGREREKREALTERKLGFRGFL